MHQLVGQCITSFSFFLYQMECVCVNLCAVSSIMLKNWYPSPRLRVLLMGKVNRLLV